MKLTKHPKKIWRSSKTPLLFVSAFSILSACGGGINNNGDNNGDNNTAEPSGAIFALTNGHNLAEQISASTDAVDQDFTNQVVAYNRMDDGSLQQIAVYDTGGLGENIRNSGANPLASQDPLIVGGNEFVFAVNPGSESISSFVIESDNSLTAADLNVATTGESNAQNPISLTYRNNILYVANTGAYFDEQGNPLTSLPDDRNRTNSSIIGFDVGSDGSLTLIPGSEIPGIAANAGSIEFSADGRNLYVTERRTNNIITVYLDENGIPVRTADGEAMLSTLASQTPQPFGTDTFITSEGLEVLLVSEGNNGLPGQSALSSYSIEDGNLEGVSLSTGDINDPLITGFTFGCWVEIAQGPEGDFAYVANTPDGTLTSFSIREDGLLTRLESEAANAGIEGDDTQNGGGVLDTEVVWPYLYQVVNNDSRIGIWQIGSDGSLERQEAIEVVDTDLLRPRMFVGIAGF